MHSYHEMDMKNLVEQIAPDDEETNLFLMRLNCVQSWFLRCSSKQKETFLNLLFETMTCEENFEVLVNALDYRADKLNMYTNCLETTNFIYDKKLRDHNRSIDKKAMEESVSTNIDWYKKLENEEQIQIILQLLKLSGGALIKRIYDTTLPIYKQKLCKIPQTIQKPIADHDELNSMFNNYLKKSSLNLKDPLNVDVEKKRKMWKDLISKYRAQVEGKQEKSSGKGGKNSKSTKSKSSKGSKSPKNKKKQENGNLDKIQLLPIWIVKQIFSYLDNKTLKKAKTVNSYWSYVITDLLKEKGARKNLDKSLKKMKGVLQIDEDEDEFKCNELKETYRISKVDKRLERMAERGAIDPKLRSANEAKSYKNSLVPKAIQERNVEYMLPIDVLDIYPRINPNDETLQKSPSCVLNEIGKTFTPKPVGGSQIVTIVENVSLDTVRMNADANKGIGFDITKN